MPQDSPSLDKFAFDFVTSLRMALYETAFGGGGLPFCFRIATVTGVANPFQARNLLALVNLPKKRRCLIRKLY